MILLAFSIPRPTPNIRIIIPITRATICHTLLPNALAILPNEAAKPSVSEGASAFPVKAPIMYLRIQPITTV